MKAVDFFKKNSALFFSALALVFTSCSEDDEVAAPAAENILEEFTDVELTFTNVNDNTDIVTVLAQDEDGEGPGSIEIIGEINLQRGATYELSFEITNELADEEDEHEEEEEEHEEGEEHDDEDEHAHGEDVTEEIQEESDDHQFFFAFPEGAFTNPSGNGNIDNTSDEVNYLDEDENGRPLGLSTQWVAADSETSGVFNVVLKHQPGIKSDTSTAQDGDSDFDLNFVLNIE